MYLMQLPPPQGSCSQVGKRALLRLSVATLCKKKKITKFPLFRVHGNSAARSLLVHRDLKFGQVVTFSAWKAPIGSYTVNS